MFSFLQLTDPTKVCQNVGNVQVVYVELATNVHFAKMVKGNSHQKTFSQDKSRKLKQKNTIKVEKILKSSLDLIPSPSVQIQIMGGKVCLRRKGKTLLVVVNKLLKTESLLTSPSNAQWSSLVLYPNF